MEKIKRVWLIIEIYAVLAYRIIAELFKSVKQFFKIPL